AAIPVTVADVERAREVVGPVLHRTPLFSSRSLSDRIGTAAYLKAENFQRTGSFKPRGAVFAVSRLSNEQRERGIVTMSAGIAVAVAARRPGARVVGVEPTGAAAMRRALDAGKPVRLERIDTIADGLAAPIAGTIPLDIIRRLVADIVVIGDDLIAEGMRFLAQRAKLVAEPAGAAATGALLAGKIAVRPGERVVSIVSGGNVDL